MLVICICAWEMCLYTEYMLTKTTDTVYSVCAKTYCEPTLAKRSVLSFTTSMRSDVTEKLSARSL